MKRLLLATLFAGLFSYISVAQETKTAAQPADTKPADCYRLDYTIRDFQKGKVASTRNYALVVLSNNSPVKLRSGSRIPVLTGGTVGPNRQFQYMDVGTDIDAKVVANMEGGAYLYTVAEVSTVMSSDQTQPDTDVPPLLRKSRAETTSPIPVGKPLLVASMDDPSLERRIEIEVLATKLR